MTTFLTSPQRNAIADEGDQKGPCCACGFNAPTPQPRRQWLVPAGRFPVAASSRWRFAHGGRFPYKKSREFPWRLNIAGEVPKIKNRCRGPWKIISGTLPNVRFITTSGICAGSDANMHTAHTSDRQKWFQFTIYSNMNSTIRHERGSVLPL